MSIREQIPKAWILKLFDRIKSMEPVNATKIMGYVLIQDFTDDVLMQLAFGPEDRLNDVVSKAKCYLRILSNSGPAQPNNGGQHSPFSLPSPTGNYSDSDFGFTRRRPANSLPFHRLPNTSTSTPPFMLSGKNQLTGDYPSILSDLSKNEDLVDPMLAHLHRRSYSASDAYQGLDGPSFGTGSRPCLYHHNKGFCKNGDDCKFAHSGFGDAFDSSADIVGSSSNCAEMKLQKEIMSLKASQLSRLAVESQLAHKEEINLPLKQQYDSQRSAALWEEEETTKCAGWQSEMSDFLGLGFAEKGTHASRQIYLTFPSESNFKDDDVSDYFSKFGPVQDVRIPYQQKRMFGFVTFHFPETVKKILGRGNPHFICDSRVLVKPYKEKGKFEDRRLQKETDKGDFSACLSPSSLDCIESFDLSPVASGPRSLHNAHEMAMRRKLEEQAYLKQVINQQSRWLMNLQLPGLKNDYTHHHQRSQSVGTCDSLHMEPPVHVNQNATLLSDNINKEVAQDNGAIRAVSVEDNKQKILPINKGIGNRNEGSSSLEEHESLDYLLPCNLLSSPTSSARDDPCVFSNPLTETDESTDILFSASSEKNPLLAATSASNRIFYQRSSNAQALKANSGQ